MAVARGEMPVDLLAVVGKGDVTPVAHHMDEAQAGQGLGKEGQHEHQPGILPAPQRRAVSFFPYLDSDVAQPAQAGCGKRFRQVCEPVVEAAGTLQHRVNELVQYRRRMAQIAGMVHRFAHEEAGGDQRLADCPRAGTAGRADQHGSDQHGTGRRIAHTASSAARRLSSRTRSVSCALRAEKAGVVRMW